MYRHNSTQNGGDNPPNYLALVRECIREPSGTHIGHLVVYMAFDRRPGKASEPRLPSRLDCYGSALRVRPRCTSDTRSSARAIGTGSGRSSITRGSASYAAEPDLRMMRGIDASPGMPQVWVGRARTTSTSGTVPRIRSAPATVLDRPAGHKTCEGRAGGERAVSWVTHAVRSHTGWRPTLPGPAARQRGKVFAHFPRARHVSSTEPHHDSGTTTCAIRLTATVRR